MPRRCLALILMLLAGAAQATTPCVKTVRWEPEQPPYNLQLADGRRGGYYADLVREALRRLGCETRFVDMRWARGVHELEAGRIDIVPGLLRTAARERFAHFTRGVNLSPNRLYLRPEARRRYPALRGLADLRGTDLRIGVESGALYGPDYNALLSDPRFAERLRFTPSQKTGWEMLAVGRLDGVISDDVRARVVGLPLQPADSDVQSVLTVAAEAALIGLSRQSVDAAFVQRFDAVLGEMVADGTLARLRERYIPCPMDPETLGCRIDATRASP